LVQEIKYAHVFHVILKSVDDDSVIPKFHEPDFKRDSAIAIRAKSIRAQDLWSHKTWWSKFYGRIEMATCVEKNHQVEKMRRTNPLQDYLIPKSIGVLTYTHVKYNDKRTVIDFMTI